MFAGFLILDHAENIFRNFYTEAPPDTTRARRLTGQPLQVSGLPELRRSARTNIGAWEKLLHPWIHATEVFPHASARSVAKDFLSRATSGIAEEVERMAAYLSPPDTVFCRNDACANHTDQVPVDTAGAYDSFGKTTTGSPRWRCSVCDKTFSQNTKATARQRDHHKNKTIIKLLVNKIFVRRIIEVADISPKTFYHRLNFLHRQCQAFSAHRERVLASLPIRRLYLGLDRQDYLVNWIVRKDKRSIQLSAIAAVDNEHGYCFGIHLNQGVDTFA